MVAPTSWINNLDLLAQEGVLHNDEASYVLGAPQRYIGNPAYTPAPVFPEGSPQMRQPLQQDAFKPDSIQTLHNPNWKRHLFNATCLALLVLGGYKICKFSPKLKGKGFFVGAAALIGAGCKKIGNAAVTCWNKFTGLFKR